MKKVSKFRRWLLKLFGGVPKADYDLVVEQRDNFIGDLKINDLQIKSLECENKELKSQLVKDPSTPVYIRALDMHPKTLERKVSFNNMSFQVKVYGEEYVRDTMFGWLADEAKKYMVFNRDERNQQYVARVVVGEEIDVL